MEKLTTMESGWKMEHNLEQLLAEVVQEYGSHKGYVLPTIGWSKSNRIYSFGEYQYWTNHIIVSNLLDNRQSGCKYC